MASAVPRLTFGCEFEFLLAHLPPGRADPQEGTPGLAPLLRIDETRSWESEEIFAHLRKTLKSHGFRVVTPRDLGADPQEEDHGDFDVVDPTVPRRLQHTDKWDVSVDISVRETQLPMYNWKSIEITSPVFRDRESADREMACVLNLIKAHYRVRVNPSAGFHVHVGNGTEWLPFQTLKRMGALLWAADPLLSRLHAPWRRVYHYSNSIRYESNLACFGHAVVPAPDEVVRTAHNGGGPGGDDDDDDDDDADQPLLAEPEQTIHELPGPMAEDEQSDDDANAEPTRPRSVFSGDAEHHDPMSDYLEVVPVGTLDSETFELTDDQVRWLVDNLPDLEARTAFIEKCITTFGHWDVHLLTGDELYTVLVKCAPGIENGEVVHPWSGILDQWIATLTEDEDGLWHPRPLRLNRLNAPDVIGNFEAMLDRVKQQVGQDGTAEYVRRSTEGETPDDSMRMTGLLRALNNHARSPEVPYSVVNSPFDPTDNQWMRDDLLTSQQQQQQQQQGDDDTNNEPPPVDHDDDDGSSSFLTDTSGTRSEASDDGDYNPPAFEAASKLFENAPESSLASSSSGSHVEEVTQAAERMPLSSTASRSISPSSDTDANDTGSESQLTPGPLRVINVPDSGNGRGAIANHKPQQQQHTDAAAAAAAAAETVTKLRPHDPAQIPASYRHADIRREANWPRMHWVPTAANRHGEAGGTHALDEPGVCEGRDSCREHPSTTLWEGVAALTAADEVSTADDVGALLGSDFRRLNYNFRSYSRPYSTRLEHYNIRTVEFREAGGTLDVGDDSVYGAGDESRAWGWAQVWSRVCVGIVEWAAAASVVQFLEVLDRLAEQEAVDQKSLEQDDADRYDVCDFLEDLCLFAEAAWVRRRERESGPPR